MSGRGGGHGAAGRIADLTGIIETRLGKGCRGAVVLPIGASVAVGHWHACIRT